MADVQKRDAGRPGELSPDKRRRILDGARTLFRELGYERTSVDAIATRAGVSKATIYNHFRDKKALFLASFGAETQQLREKFHALLETPGDDIEADLRRIGEQFLRLSLSPSNIDRFRAVVADVGRFPELGQALWECGALVGRKRFALYFERAAARGLLEVHDPEDAATDFWSLCCADLSRQLQLGVLSRASDELVRRHVDRAIRTFLRAYRPR